MDQLYKGSNSRVTGFEERRIEPFRWISLGGDSDRIPLEAADFMQDPSNPRTDALTGPTGALLQMESARTPSWHHLAKHWRDWIPVPENPDLRPKWFFQLGNHTKKEDDGKGQCCINADLIVEIGNDLRDVELSVQDICREKGYTNNPQPEAFQQSELYKAYNSTEDLERTIAGAKRNMLEHIGFLNWWVLCVPSRANWFSINQRREFLEEGYHHMPKQGVLLSLQCDWRQVNIPMLIKHDVPVHYPWTDNTTHKPHFARLDPVILGTFDTLESQDLNSDGIPNWDAWFLNLSLYNQYLEKHYIVRENGASLGPPTFKLEYWIVNFQGWHQRFITNHKDIREYEQQFECVTVNSSTVRTRIFYRWHPHQLFARLEPNAEEYPYPEEVSLWSKSEEDDEENSRDPVDLDEL
jgi:hypothetical protein